ncbi:cytochrome b [Ancylobacter pratisalsi]|uniref:Cytochrome b n=1 Tax=Ancylobacter pratisalsi TaxID=1745854 RepID=A0A6P1YQ30_9HYPH|nr:cytochrome b [Ancylobacter pratisalsi]QIB34806.1 cytochrome b [Ancylobacter pratisalsi]
MPTRYDRVAMSLHWLVAVLVILQFATGWTWGFFERGTEPRFYLFRTHLFSGYAILALAVLRTGWRITHRAPVLPAGMSRPMEIAAHATHGLLYLSILVQPVLGILTITAIGKSLGTGPIHVALAYVIAAIVALHVAAALWHHFIRRDGLIARMLPARD